MSIQMALPRLSEPLKIWEKIEIVVGEGTTSGKYASRIEDFRGSNIIISNPEFISGGTRLTDRCQVWVLVVRADATYRFSCRITRTAVGGLQSYLLTDPSDVERVQRRMFYRIELLTPLRFRSLGPAKSKSYISAGESDHHKHESWFSDSAIDISGGGILFGSEGHLNVGDVVLLKIAFLAEQGLPEIIAGICRRLCDRSGRKCAGIEFICAEQLTEFLDGSVIKALPRPVRDFDRKAQNRLVTAIFHKQVEYRQKGVLG